ncbi:MAG: SRPBCC domain-containing protein [Nitrososphaeraceae archaeon]
MKQIQTEIEIYSSPATAWKILTDFSSFHKWNPIITQIAGEARLGEKLKICVKTSKGTVRTYTPTITVLNENHELRWKGKSFLPGLLNGERIFTFIQISEERIRLQHSELFTGLGSFVAGARLFKDIETSLQQMNNAFKKRVEETT